jgi:hypothetical protein
MRALTEEDEEQMGDEVMPEGLMPARWKKMNPLHQGIFLAWAKNPTLGFRDLARLKGVSYFTVKRAAQDHDWRGMMSEFLGRQAGQIMAYRAQEASVALLSTINQLGEMWRTLDCMRQHIFEEDDEGERKVRSDLEKPLSALEAYMKMQRVFIEMQREVTGLAMMDKREVSSASSMAIVNNVNVAFGDDYGPSLR